MKKKCLALLPLIALRLTGCDLGGNNIPVSAEKGDKGDTGPQGPKGDKGDTGATGPQGEKGDKGDTGATGPQGEKGDKGDTGISGKDGNSLLTGDGAPSSSLGKDGDSYVDVSTWDYYTKADGKWTKAGNFKGNKGDKGDTGATGPKGDTGLQGPKGDKGDTGAKGDDAITYVPCIFKNYDGTTLYEFYYEKGSDIVYDGPAPVKKEKDEEGNLINWIFVGWDKSLKNIQKPTIFTARFECHYTCTFLNYDGSTLYSAKVNRGEDVSYEGDTPLKPDTVDGETAIHWTFTGWDKDLTDIKADTIFTAQFDSPNAIKCTFLNYDGTLLGYSYCGKGGKAVYEGETPTKASTELDGVITGYRFSRWDKQQTNIQESTTFTAQYETYTSYECKFVNYDGTLLYSMAVVPNGAASYKGESPFHDFEIGEKNKDGTTNVVSYSFKGWDKNLTRITAPTTFTATYDSTSYAGYRVEFRSKDGSEIYHTYTKKGENAACSYERIKDLISSSYSYDSENVTMFAGWNQSTSDVQSDLVLTANIATISRKQNGEYPQTQVEDDKLISKLNSITQTDAQGYVSYGGEKYKKMSYHWRKVEPIQWRYLSQDGDNVQFVSEKVLDSHVWNQTDHENGIYRNNYQYSDIRTWLNNDFLEQAFYYDPSLIQTVNVDNSAKSTGDSINPYACEDTQDKVYLLSYKDILNEDYGFMDDASRIAYDAYGNACDYWLRSPFNYYDHYARYVNSDGGVDNSGVSISYGVRPALTRKLD